MARKKAGGEVGGAAREDMLSLQEAASALGVSRSTFQRWLVQGRVRGFKVGRQWRFRQSDVDKFSRMSHPSAAAVNVAELEKITARAAPRRQTGERLSFDPELADYPVAEEEKAVDGLFRALVAGAVEAGASDVHIDPTRDETSVRQRVDGVLHEVLRVPRSAHQALVACTKAHAGIPSDQQQVAQDGRFHVRLKGSEHDLRVATIPSVYGESVVIRLLARTAELVGLDRVGMSERDLERYKRALHAPVGLLIVSGPTGSGKTTVLYGGLLEITTPERKMFSIEDPVEVVLPHVTQTAVNRKAGFTFEAAQRAVMRHDPDVILVGGIQNLEGAELAVEAAITGHLVMTTLHVRSAPAAIWRLLDMGVEPFMVAETLICVVSTRLARKVCPDCVRPEEPAFAVLSPFAERARAGGYEIPDNAKFVRGAGCDKCRNTGYRGRTGLYEVIEVDADIERMIAAREPAEAIRRAAVGKGMTTLAADGLRKAAEGITSLAEAMRVTYLE